MIDPLRIESLVAELREVAAEARRRTGRVSAETAARRRAAIVDGVRNAVENGQSSFDVRRGQLEPSGDLEDFAAWLDGVPGIKVGFVPGGENYYMRVYFDADAWDEKGE